MAYRFEETNEALLGSLGAPRRVLDVGCGTGINGREARRRGAWVVGIETDADAVAIARTRLDAVIVADITRDDSGLTEALGEQRFDAILFGDVLEHVVDPAAVLARFLPFLEPDGRVLLSLPNVAAWPVRMALARGRFRYEDAGILDRTHLRFFTYETALSLCTDVGLEILHTDYNPLLSRAARDVVAPYLRRGDDAPVHDLGDEPAYRFYRSFVRPIEHAVAKLAVGALSFQHIVVARKPVEARRRPLSLVVGMLTYDEEGSVAAMIDGIRAEVPDAAILVVDSSRDRTPEIARAKGATVLRQVPARGHGPAMELLLAEASLKADALIYLDCDFTYPLAYLRTFRALLEDGADVVNGARTRRKPAAMPLANYLANRAFAATTSLANAVPTTDVHSGMRGYRSSCLRAFRFDGEGDALPIDTLVRPARAGYQIVDLPIPYDERAGVSKLAKLRGTAWTFVRIAKAVGVHQKPRRYDVRPR